MADYPGLWVEFNGVPHHLLLLLPDTVNCRRSQVASTYTAPNTRNKPVQWTFVHSALGRVIRYPGDYLAAFLIALKKLSQDRGSPVTTSRGNTNYRNFSWLSGIYEKSRSGRYIDACAPTEILRAVVCHRARSGMRRAACDRARFHFA